MQNDNLELEVHFGTVRKHVKTYAPPKFNFGWSMSEDDVLDALEATHPELIVNMTVYKPLEHTSEEDINPEATMERVHQYMVNEWYLPSTWRPRIEYKMPNSDVDELGCLTITNTYEDGVAQPPADVVHAMKDIFNLEEEPKWFLDFHHGTWQERWIVFNDDKQIEVMT